MVAGCPPDGFTPDGQLWGNPIYDWARQESEGFAWWLKRIAEGGLRIGELKTGAWRYLEPEEIELLLKD